MYIEMESLERRCEATTTSMCPSNNTTPPTYCIGLDGYYILAGAWSSSSTCSLLSCRLSVILPANHAQDRR